jgi:hypothetical protein
MPSPSTLVVRNHFGKYKRGDRITDSAEIAKILAGKNHGNVVAAKARPLSAPPAAAPMPEKSAS